MREKAGRRLSSEAAVNELSPAGWGPGALHGFLLHTGCFPGDPAAPLGVSEARTGWGMQVF